jgi:fluoride exporter
MDGFPSSSIIPRMDFLRQMLLVTAGGALGSALRFSVNAGFARYLSPDAVWPTLAVNIVGSFLITLVMELAAAEVVSPQWRLFLTTGVMGGLTTYSAFNHAMVDALRRGEYASAMLNMTLTVILCLGAGFLALYLASRMNPAT